MAQLPKLLALDVDGTLISHAGAYSKRTLDAINALKEAGVEIVYVTGRPPRWMNEVTNAFGAEMALIANGALIYDMKSDIVIKSFNIDFHTQQRIFLEISKYHTDVAFAIEWNHSFAREKKYIARWDDGKDDIGSLNIESLTPLPVYKILIRSLKAGVAPDNFLAEISKTIAEFANVTYCNLDDPLLEISAKDVSKGSTLKHYALSKGITAEEVFAIGDNINDFSMLEWAGTSWIMEDGHPEGKNYATFVAPSFEKDGAALVMESILFEAAELL